MPVVPAGGFAPPLVRFLRPMPLLFLSYAGKLVRVAGFAPARTRILRSRCLLVASHAHWSPQPVLPWLLQVENLPT